MATTASIDEKNQDVLKHDLVGSDDPDGDAIQWSEEEEGKLVRKRVSICYLQTGTCDVY